MLHHGLRKALKSFNYVINSNVANVDLYSTLVSAGWRSHMRPIVTINSNVYVYSTSTATPAITISGNFSEVVNITNNGYIVGMGGAGGSTSNDGQSGGTGLSVSSPIKLINNGIIAGGGGGGAGGTPSNVGGGGGGGMSGLTNSAGGTSPYNSGGQGTYVSPGSGGQGSSTGSIWERLYIGSSGGSGGSWGNPGANSAGGTVNNYYQGQYTYSGKLGGAGGSSVVGNSYITWIATGTRYGTVS